MATYESEHLAETVRNYEVLYNKAHPEFHRKHIKRNVWKAVAEALGIEDGIFSIILYKSSKSR